MFSQRCKIQSMIGLRSLRERRKKLRHFVRGKWGRIPGQQRIVQTLSSNRPGTKIFCARPNQPQSVTRKLRNRLRGTAQKLVRARDVFFGENEQKLLSAARTQKHPRELQLREQRPWQHLAKETEPCAPPN